MCKCKYCGKEFDNKQKLGGHIIHCEKNPNFEKGKKQLELARKNIQFINKHLYCQYCGKEVANNGCLTIHEKSCINNPNREKCPNRKGNGGKTKGYKCKWKGKNKFNDPILAKIGKTRKQKFDNGEYIFNGHKHTEKTKQHLREIFEEKVKCQR